MRFKFTIMDCTKLFNDVCEASRKLVFVSEEETNNILCDVADAIDAHTAEILAANAKDLARMDKSNPIYDRLQLTEKRIADIANDMRNVASLAYPIGLTLESKTLPNGLKLKKITVPIGVIGMIYEARPNVTYDVFSLCLKSGNACILKGGSDAYDSNVVGVNIIKEVLRKHNVDENSIALMPAGHAETEQLLKATDYVDLIIPRGSKRLIDFVRQNSLVPVIETGAGICHTYFDEFGNLEWGKRIIFNAKTRRVSVCNALDCVIINQKRLADLPELIADCATKNVIAYADEQAYNALSGKYPENLLQHADNESFGTEFMDYKMAIKTVANINEALQHITKYSSKHSECIVTDNQENANLFQTAVDAAVVYVNAPTAFTDGAQFGLGAEIGISTQKLHARGPMALRELTSYKWLVNGEGQTRE